MLCSFVTKIISMSLMSICAIIVTIIFKKILCQKLSPKAHLYIWVPVIAHLIIPHSFSSKMSIYNHVPETIVTLTDFDAISANNVTTVISTASGNSFQINILFYLWIMGAILSLTIHLVSYYRFRRTLIYSIQERPEAKSVSEDCASVCGIKTVPLLQICQNNISPMILGIIKPTLIIPSFVFETFTPTQIKLIFTHEYVHLKRKDRFVNLLLLLVSTIHWFNPLVWIMCRFIRQDMENVCDEETMLVLNDECRKIYGRTIVDLLEKNTMHFVNPMSSTMAYTTETLKLRIANLCNFGKNRLKIIILPITIMISTTFLTGAIAEKASDTAKLISDSISELPSVSDKRTNMGSHDTAIEFANESSDDISYSQTDPDSLTHTQSGQQTENHRATSNVNTEEIHISDGTNPLRHHNTENEQITIEAAQQNPGLPSADLAENPVDISDTEQHSDSKKDNISDTYESHGSNSSKVYTYSSDDSTGVFSEDKENSAFTADNGHIRIETVGLISSSDSNMSGYFNVYRDGELVGESVRASVSASPNSINFNQTVGSEHDYSFSVDSKTIND